MSLDRLPISYILIAINVVISLYAFENRELLYDLSFQVGPVLDGQYYRMLTSGFLHVDFNHLLFNMLTLFFFGPVLEDERTLGKMNFLILYFGSLIGGSAAALLLNLNDPYYAAVGASGAISGVMAAVSLFAPFMVILIFGIIPIPAVLYAIGFIGISAFAMGSGAGGIAHEAHLGGALTGLLLAIMLFPPVLGLFIRQIQNKLNRRR